MERSPAGFDSFRGVVFGPDEALWIAEALLQQGFVAVGGMPLSGNGPQGQAESLGGEIGASSLIGNKEAAELHDEFETMRPGDRIPADGFITVFKMPGCGTPDEDGGDLPVLQNKLAEPVASPTKGSKEVFVVEKLMSQLPVSGCHCDLDAKVGWLLSRDDATGGRCRRFH